MGDGSIVGLIWLAVVIFAIVSWWKVFEKARQPGWASLVPIYNMYVILKIAGKPGWWLLLLFVPLVNIVIVVLATLGLAKSFGKGVGFALGLMFLNIIFAGILAFGDSQYIGERAA